MGVRRCLEVVIHQQLRPVSGKSSCNAEQYKNSYADTPRGFAIGSHETASSSTRYQHEWSVHNRNSSRNLVIYFRQLAPPVSRSEGLDVNEITSSCWGRRMACNACPPGTKANRVQTRRDTSEPRITCHKPAIKIPFRTPPASFGLQTTYTMSGRFSPASIASPPGAG